MNKKVVVLIIVFFTTTLSSMAQVSGDIFSKPQRKMVAELFIIGANLFITKI